MRFAIVGAGFSGAVVARELVEAGHTADVFDTRDHVAGNCHTARHETGVMVHTYGPHIFHTQHEHVWQYINRFGEMMPYRHKVKAISQGTMYSLPVNLKTINQFFDRNFDAEQAEQFIQSFFSRHRVFSLHGYIYAVYEVYIYIFFLLSQFFFSA